MVQFVSKYHLIPQDIIGTFIYLFIDLFIYLFIFICFQYIYRWQI